MIGDGENIAMDILFIHENYPAQFKYLAPILGQSGNRVVFLTAREDANSDPMLGVEIRKFKCHRKRHPETHNYLDATEESVLRGQAVLREISSLYNEGFIPKITISHSGMGLGLFIKEYLEKTIHIGYFEWYFRKNTTKNLILDYTLDAQLKSGLRNLPILQELECCDIGVVPTKWQKSQFPDAYKNKLEVIFDGVDTSFFHPNEHESKKRKEEIYLSNRETNEKYRINSNDTVMSYATRGMETLRGFPEFMRALPACLKANADLKVIIAGNDRRAYSYDAPTHGGSWKNKLVEELGDYEGRERVIYTGLLNYEDYRKLLWRTNIHCYFTRPYVTSWSLFEAAACGAPLVVSRNGSTEGIVDEETANWVDIENQSNVSETLNRILNKKEGMKCRLKKGYDLQTSMSQWASLLNRLIQTI